MTKLNAIEYTKDLVRTNGIDVAYRIAERCAKASHASNETLLPNPMKNANVFFPNVRKGGTTQAIRERARTHGFWAQVLGILKKSH